MPEPAEQSWPPYGIRIRTPRLEMRVIQEHDLPEVIDLVKAGIHDPDVMPFLVPFTDRQSPELEWGTYRWHSTNLASTADKWALAFGVWLDGSLVGEQGIHGEGFAKKRALWSGSWLARDRHGNGFGKEMRTAILYLAFDALAAQLATPGC